MRVLAFVLLVIPCLALAHEVLVKPGSNLRAEPSSSSERLAQLAPGKIATLIEFEPQGGYVHVAFEDQLGWLWKRNVEFIQEYRREEWKHLVDKDRDCQNTRQEVLIEGSEIAVTFKSGRSCKVAGGTGLTHALVKNSPIPKTSMSTTWCRSETRIAQAVGDGALRSAKRMRMTLNIPSI